MFDLTVSWLTDLLPSRDDDRVVTVQEAVKQVIADHHASGRPASCWDVIGVLEAGEDEAARSAARALRIHVDQGFAQLGFAPPDTPAVGGGQQAGGHPARAQPAATASRRASGDDPGGTDQPGRAATACRFCDAGDGRRSQGTQGSDHRRGMVAASKRHRGRAFARTAGQVGALGERDPDPGCAHGGRRPGAGQPDRRQSSCSD